MFSKSLDSCEGILGDGGRTKKTVYGAATSVTRYVGAIFEIFGAKETAHFHLGDMHIAALSDGEVNFFHHDHLGGTNVITDAEGVKKELIEYLPFGAFSRHEKYGSGEDVIDHYFTGQRFDKESDLYYYNARYYDPSLGRFIQADTIVQNPDYPQTFNRYSYAGNNPINNIDPSGNIFGFIAAAIKAIISFAITHPAITGAIIGGTAGAVTSYNATGSINFTSVALGALRGGLAGATLGINPGGLEQVGHAFGLVQASAAVSLTAQVTEAAGLEEVTKTLNFAATAMSAAYIGINLTAGIKDWIHEGRFGITDGAGNPVAAVKSNSKIGVGGVTDPGANNLASNGLDYIAANPSSGPVADFTEAFLSKLTFTSSVDRQLANAIRGLNNISLIGHSQGSIIVSNTLLNLGLSGNRSVVSNATFFANPLSQVRTYISAAVGGLRYAEVDSFNRTFDLINVVGPNLNPVKMGGGVVGLLIPKLGVSAHTNYGIPVAQP